MQHDNYQNNKKKISMPLSFPVTAHTDYVGHNSIFVVIKGFLCNGAQFISQAIKKGARTIVVDKNETLSDEVCALIKKFTVCVQRVDDTRKALAVLSAQHAQFPTQKLRIIGITGTKGKTTTAYLLAHILRQNGYRVALVGTLGIMIDGKLIDKSLTTPQPDYLHQFFALCVVEQVDFVIMEVSAQALTLHRVHGIMFDYAAMTNIAREHFEFYSSMDEYVAAKKKIINHVLSSDYLLINGDDNYLQTMCGVSFGVGKDNDHQFIVQGKKDHSVAFTLGDGMFACPQLLGNFNAYNCALAVLIAQKISIQDTEINYALQSFIGVPGRMQFFTLSNGARAVIDYAHNPSSYDAVLSLLRGMTDHLLVVFGASGSRDQGKRALMGRVASQYADVIILTSDNPGEVNPQIIIDDIVSGVDKSSCCKVERCIDRQKAIEFGFKLTRKNSILVVLGKGMDEYQVMSNKKHFFSEREIIESLL